MHHIGVKFCGNCQPRRDMLELYACLKKTEGMEFVRWSEPDYAVLLVLQACDAACAELPPFEGPKVEVIGSRLNFVEYEETDELVRAVVAALRTAARGGENVGRNAGQSDA